MNCKRNELFISFISVPSLFKSVWFILWNVPFLCEVWGNVGVCLILKVSRKVFNTLLTKAQPLSQCIFDGNPLHSVKKRLISFWAVVFPVSSFVCRNMANFVYHPSHSVLHSCYVVSGLWLNVQLVWYRMCILVIANVPSLCDFWRVLSFSTDKFCISWQLQLYKSPSLAN